MKKFQQFCIHINNMSSQNNPIRVCVSLKNREGKTVLRIEERVFDGGKDSAQPQIIASEVDYIKLAVNDVRRRPCPDLLQWNTEIDNKLFQINVNRDDETVIIRGEANDWEQREKIEHIIKLRAPNNFQIINAIDIYKIDLQNIDLGQTLIFQ